LLCNQKIIDLQPEVPYHTYTIAETEAQLKTNIIEGLSTEEAAVRIRLYGTNELKGSGGVLWYRVLWRQIANPLVVVLLIANVSSMSRFMLNVLSLCPKMDVLDPLTEK
jgi:Na+-exporting ATPase